MGIMEQAEQAMKEIPAVSADEAIAQRGCFKYIWPWVESPTKRTVLFACALQKRSASLRDAAPRGTPP